MRFIAENIKHIFLSSVGTTQKEFILKKLKNWENSIKNTIRERKEILILKISIENLVLTTIKIRKTNQKTKKKTSFSG